MIVFQVRGQNPHNETFLEDYVDNMLFKLEFCRGSVVFTSCMQGGMLGCLTCNNRGDAVEANNNRVGNKICLITPHLVE